VLPEIIFSTAERAESGRGRQAQNGGNGSLLKPSLLIFVRPEAYACTNPVAPACEKRACDRKIGD